MNKSKEALAIAKFLENRRNYVNPFEKYFLPSCVLFATIGYIYGLYMSPIYFFGWLAVWVWAMVSIREKLR